MVRAVTEAAAAVNPHTQALQLDTSHLQFVVVMLHQSAGMQL